MSFMSHQSQLTQPALLPRIVWPIGRKAAKTDFSAGSPQTAQNTFPIKFSDVHHVGAAWQLSKLLCRSLLDPAILRGI